MEETPPFDIRKSAAKPSWKVQLVLELFHIISVPGVSVLLGKDIDLVTMVKFTAHIARHPRIWRQSVRVFFHVIALVLYPPLFSHLGHQGIRSSLNPDLRCRSQDLHHRLS